MRVKRLSIHFSSELGRFPNFHVSGSVRGMKQNVYGKDALLVRCGQYIYDVSSEPRYYSMAY